jgi:hypothetical protein
MVITSTRSSGGFTLADIADDVAFGRVVVEEGGLQVLRELLGMSRHLMSELLYVSLDTYTRWEIDPNTQLWPQNAGRIARFYRSAMNQVEWLLEEGINPKDIMPISEYARNAGLSQEHIVRAYRNGEIWCLDLGMLGLWMYR